MMLLSNLLTNFVPIPKDADVAISGLTLDSRAVKKGDAFFAIKGNALDGRQYINQAIANGAVAIITEAESESLDWHDKTPIISLPQLQKKLGFIAARFYDYPAKKLQMIGVTGTSGKTSCTHFIAQIFNAQKLACGIIGSLGNGLYGNLGEAGLTTPDAITIQSTLHGLAQQGAKAVAMEVSSHSIDQMRIAGCEFETGIFTNLTQDHLDYHGDMTRYAAVKRRFFSENFVQQAIYNIDDPYGQTWLNELSQQKPSFAYSTKKPANKINVPLVYADILQLNLQGIRAKIYSPWGNDEVVLPLIGEFNLSNALAALAALCSQGMPFETVIPALAQLQPVPGRMQILGGQDRPLIVVDHAHKPDPLLKALQTLRAHTKGKLICVFGCGGERDQTKRPIMAKIAEQWADQVIVTNDNPRHENPEAIAAQISQGFIHPERVLVMLDRSKAIEKSIQCAKASDCILIAGKGAECYQIIGDEKIPFADVETVKEFL